MKNGPLDRIGDAGILTFDLNNSTTNTAGLLGYYSPGHANYWAGWTIGLPVRLGFVFETITYYKWYGNIAPKGIFVNPGVYGNRRVTVSCWDYMAQLAVHEINLLSLATNKRIDEAVPLVVANMPRAPIATSYATGVETFATVFDGITKGARALGVINDLLLSEWAYGYVKGDKTGGETLVIEAQDTRPLKTNTILPKSRDDCSVLTDESGNILTDESDNILVADEAGATAILENPIDVKTSFGTHQTNRTILTAYPRKVDAVASTILFTLQTPIKLSAGETKTGVRCMFRDPSGASTRINGKEITISATANAQADGLGANKTANLTVTTDTGTDAVEHSLYNSDGSDIYVITLTATGKGIYLYDYVQMVVEDSSSQTRYEAVLTTTINCRYQNDPAKVDTISDYVLARNTDPHTTVDSARFCANRDATAMFCFLELEPGTKAAFSESVTAVSDNYFIQGYSFEINDANIVFWSPVLTNDPGYYVYGKWDEAIWDTSLWGP